MDIMEAVKTIAAVLALIAGIIVAVRTIVQPITTQLHKIGKLEDQVSNLNSWTEKQQKDLLDISERLSLLFGASYALLDHAIETQNGNGKCHEAFSKMEVYKENKVRRLESYKEENK